MFEILPRTMHDGLTKDPSKKVKYEGVRHTISQVKWDKSDRDLK